MDAAHKSLKKTALFLAVALLAVVPGRAQQLQVSSTTVALNDNQARSIQVSVSGSNTAVPYTVSGLPFWLTDSSTNNFTTPDTLSFQLENTICGSCTAQITLNAAGSNPVPVTVTYSPGGSGGNGALTASSTVLSFSALSGQSATSQPITLSTTSTSGVNIASVSSDQTSWLSASITSGSFTVTPSFPATLTVSATAANLANGNYSGHITITPSVGTATVITVNFTVGTGTGGGTGTIFANPSAFSLTAASGGVSLIQSVTLTTASSTAVQILGIVPDVNWLSIALTSQTVSSSAPATLSVQASAGSLSTGTYTGHLTINPAGAGNSPTTITVTFTVGTGTGGSNGTIVATPNALTFSAQSGQNASSQNVTLSSNSSVSINSIQSDQTNWLSASITGGSFTVTPSSSATLTVSASAASLVNGTYTGHITITPSSGTATVIGVTFIVGTGTGGGSQGTITADHTSFNFTYPSNTLAAVVNIGSSNPAVTMFNVTVSSQSNWLVFQNVSSGTYNNVVLGPFNITVNQQVAAALANGTYTGTLTLTNPQNANDITTVNLTLTVTGSTGTGGGTGTVSVTPSTLTFTASPGGSSQSQNLTVTVGNNTTVTLTATSYNGPFFSISSAACSGTPNSTTTCSFTGSTTITITVNPSVSNNFGTYNGVLTFQTGSSSAQASVVLNLIAPVTTLTVNPTALAFTAAAGGAAQTQTFTVAVPNSAFVNVNLTSSNGNFYSVTSSNCNANPNTSPTCSFSGDQTLAVTINPANLSNTGTYNGVIQIQSGGVTQNVSVSLTLGSGSGGGPTSSIAAPSSLTFFYQTNSQVSLPQQLITVGATGAFTATPSVGTTQQWLAVSTVSPGPGYVVVSVNPQGLTAGTTYQGAVNITAASGNVSIPVSLTVSSGLVVEPSPGSVNLTFQSTTNPTQSTINLTASDNSATPVSVTTSTSWISVGTLSNSTTPANFTVTINPATLCNGLNAGTLTVSAPNAQNNGFTIPVVALVSGSTATGCGSTGGGTLNVNVPSLSFSSSAGSNPSTQTLSVTSATGTNVAFTYTVTGNVPITATVSGASISSGQSLTTPQSITIGVNTSGLASGTTYNGTITLTPSSGSPVQIPVSLTIAASSVTATPSTLTFSFAAGSAAPSPQTVTVSGTSGSTFTATASSSGNWLSVSPTSGTVPGTLSVSVNPTGLAANTYTGTITVAGSNGASGSTTISVTLTVTAPLPTITSLGSAASYVGGSISPGEVITIFGTSIGPTPGVTLQLDPTGKVANTLGGVQVIVNGIASPMVYASNTQVSAVVPYEICANGCGPGTIAQVSVKFLGQSSNGIPTPVAATTTGIFTANASGSGEGAILNANLSANSAGNPANKGDIIAIYLTGEGQTSPSGVSGKVTTVAQTNPITPVPLLPIGVTIGGQPVNVVFFGEAPGLVSGVMQINVQIPTTVASGNLPVVVTIGSVSSQAGVTVAVR